MKKLHLFLVALLLLVTTSGYATTGWPRPCGIYDATTGQFASSVMADLETSSGDSVLRIYAGSPVAAPRMGDFKSHLDVTSPIPVYKTNSPWDDVAHTIHHVVIENGVLSVGNNAFYTMVNLESLTLPKSVASMGDTLFANNFGRVSDVYIYCSRTTPPTGVDYDGLVLVQPAFCLNEYINIYVPTEAAVTAYKASSYWKNVAGEPSGAIGIYKIYASPQATSVVSVPQDSIYPDRATIRIELIGDDEAARQKHKYQITLQEGGTIVRNFYVIYKDGKWKISNDGINAPQHRMPILHRDTVVRTTETMQIDITELKPNSSYNYSVKGRNEGGDIVMEKDGVFLTPAKSGTDVVLIEANAREAGTVRYYNLLGQPVDETYRGIIVTDKGEKILLQNP